MIKDVMVWLDGSLADEIRLEVAGSIARQFESQVVALVLNPIPLTGPIEGDVTGTVAGAELLEKAREAGDITEEKLVKRLKLLDRPVEIRRFDVLADDIATIKPIPVSMIAAISADIAYGSTSRTNLDKSHSTDRSPASLTVHTPVSYACLKFKRKFETTCGPARDAKGERLWKKDGRGSVSDPQDYSEI